MQVEHCLLVTSEDAVVFAGAGAAPKYYLQSAPILLQLLKDEFPDVRLNIISKLESVNSIFHR